MDEDFLEEQLARVSVLMGQLQELHSILLAKSERSEELQEQGTLQKTAIEQVQPLVEEYLAAIAEGDASTANRMGRVNENRPENVFLCDDVLTQAIRIQDPQVLAIYPRYALGEIREAGVRILYSLGEETRIDYLTATRDAAGWWLSDGLTARLPHTRSYSLVYGLSGASFYGELNAEVQAYPGIYTVTAPNRFYQMIGEATLMLSSRFSAFPDVDLRVIPSPEYVHEVQLAVNQRLDEALQEATLRGLERKVGFYARDTSLQKDSAVISEARILEHPVVSVGETSHPLLEVSKAQVLVTLSGANYRQEIIEEEVVGPCSFEVATEVVAGRVRVTFGSTLLSGITA